MSQLLVMSRGDTFTFTRTLLDADGEPVDLSLADITFTAKRMYRDSPTIEKTLDDGIDLGGSGDTGVVTVTLQPEDTQDFTQTERFVWDIEVEGIVGSGEPLSVLTPLSGRLVVRLDTSTPPASGS